MKTLPADIFVWGVHPSTTVEDIVNDLCESGIRIEKTDIEKKSKPEATLCSYRISVPATQLNEALDPKIWPLCVRVREFIHYSNKPRQPRSNSGKTTDPLAFTDVQQHQRQSSGNMASYYGVPTFSRFEPLNNVAMAMIPNSL